MSKITTIFATLAFALGAAALTAPATAQQSVECPGDQIKVDNTCYTKATPYIILNPATGQRATLEEVLDQRGFLIRHDPLLLCEVYHTPYDQRDNCARVVNGMRGQCGDDYDCYAPTLRKEVPGFN